MIEIYFFVHQKCKSWQIMVRGEKSQNNTVEEHWTKSQEVYLLFCVLLLMCNIGQLKKNLTGLNFRALGGSFHSKRLY